MGFLGNAFGANVNTGNYQNVVNPANMSSGDIQAQQQQFANALQGQMNGTGPSAAAQMLQNQSSQNAAATNAQAAGSRGINAGLAQRNALEANTTANQNAGQTAALARTQEQLGATQMLGGQLNTMQDQYQRGQLGSAQLNTAINQGNASNNAAISGGVLSGISSAITPPSMSRGGMVRKMATGGPVLPLGGVSDAAGNGAAALAKGFGDLGTAAHQAASPWSSKPAQNDSAINSAMSSSGGGGAGIGGDATLGSGIDSATSTVGVDGAAAGGGAGDMLGMAAMLASRGAMVPGKAKVPGDSKKNDTVPAILSPGEIVIPRSHASDPEKAKKFVEQEIAKRKLGPAHPHLVKMMEVHKQLGHAIKMMSGGGDPSDDDVPAMQPMGMMDSAGQTPGAGVSETTPDQSAAQSVPQMTAGMEQAATPQQAVQTQAAGAIAGIPQTPMSKELMDVQRREMGAAQASAAAAASGQNTIAKVYADQAKDFQTQTAEYQKNRGALDKEHNDLVTAYQNKKIDPHRVLGSTGAKIQAAISLMLGGLGQGLSHSNHNMAMDSINKAIDDDIESQKTDLNKGANLLSLNQQKFHNLDQSEAVTRMQKMAAAQALIGSAAAKSGSEQAMAAGQMAAGQIQERMIPLKNDIAYRQTLASLGGGSGGGGNPEMLHKEDRERAVTVPGPNGQSRTVLAPTSKDADTFKTGEIEHQNLFDQIQTARDFMKNKGWSPGAGPFDTADSSEAANIRSGIMLSLNKLHGLNRLNDNEFNEFSKMVPNPGQFNTAAAQAKLDYLSKRLQNSRNSSYKNLLDNYNPGQIQESAPRMKRAS